MFHDSRSQSSNESFVNGSVVQESVLHEQNTNTSNSTQQNNISEVLNSSHVLEDDFEEFVGESPNSVMNKVCMYILQWIETYCRNTRQDIYYAMLEA